jgi:hypothetical protein
MGTTKSQEWLRILSKHLELSYQSSALIKHKVTSGNSRESQILDVLKIILPQNYPLINNVIIIDSNDRETIKYDGAIVDTQNWPKLYSEDELVVAPIESVKVAFEIKSNLGKTEIDKIYKEAKDIKENSKSNDKELPKIAAFSYTCANHKLAYYDFVESFLKTPNESPFVICILNVGLFCFLNSDKNFETNLNEKSVPVFIDAQSDSLLVFIYMLTDLFADEKISTAIRKYSKHLYNDLTFFTFENSFLTKMKISTNRPILRPCFEKNLDKSLEDIYASIK